MDNITEIEIIGFVKLSYAHEHTAVNYMYKIETHDQPNSGEKGNTGVIEIGVVIENPIIFDDGESRIIAREGDIFIIPPKQSYHISTLDPGVHKHITTEAIIEYRDTDIRGDRSISLPAVIKADSRSERIADMIKKIVSKSSSLNSADYFDECSDYMKLLSHIKKYTDEGDSTESVPPSYIRYCTLAEKYAMDNLGRHVMVEEIAEHIGISKNYLTNIFSKYKGMPITEYINRMKLNHMLELMLRFGYNAGEAGEYVGLDNVNYISRIFKKYYGVTLREYRQLHF